MINEKQEKLHHCKIVPWEDMSLLAMSSLYQEREMADTYGAKHKRLTLCATGKLFSEEKIVCTTQCTLFFLGLFSFANMCAVRYL